MQMLRSRGYSAVYNALDNFDGEHLAEELDAACRYHTARRQARVLFTAQQTHAEAALAVIPATKRVLGHGKHGRPGG